MEPQNVRTGRGLAEADQRFISPSSQWRHRPGASPGTHSELTARASELPGGLTEAKGEEKALRDSSVFPGDYALLPPERGRSKEAKIIS